MQASPQTPAPRRIEIAPGFTCEDWQALVNKLEPQGHWEPCPKEWEKAISVLQKRIQHRYFDAVKALQSLLFSGFAVMALDCLLLESIQAFRAGKRAETPQESRIAYKSLLLNSPQFRSSFPDEKAVDDFYTNVRNSLLHDGETRSGYLIRRDSALVERLPDGFTVINRTKFHIAVVKEFETYIAELGLAVNRDLRKKYVAAITDLCKRSQPKP